MFKTYKNVIHKERTFCKKYSFLHSTFLTKMTWKIFLTGEPYNFIISSHMPLPVTVFMVPWLELPMGMVSLFLIEISPTDLIGSLGTSVTLPPNLRFKLAFISKKFNWKKTPTITWKVFILQRFSNDNSKSREDWLFYD